MKAWIAACALSTCIAANAAQAPEATPRWQLASGRGVVWNVMAGEAHHDFIEMNGEEVGLVVRYGVDSQGLLTVNQELVWPLLRFHPNLTGNYLRVAFGEDARLDKDDRFSAGLLPALSVRAGEKWEPLISRTLQRARHEGITQFEGTLNFANGTALAFRREIFPSGDLPAAIDTTLISNMSDKELALSVDEFQQVRKTGAERGIYGAYSVTERVLGAGTYILRPGESTRVSVVFEAHKDGEQLLTLDVAAQKHVREQRVADILEEMKLETPDPVLNTAFALAKLHTTESLFRTKAGLLHSPGGGGRYYAAIWANDQAEYANPFFGMLGDRLASEAAINSFRQFARFVNPDYRPIPSSIISEGESFWNEAGDRGDMAMIAYGASRFALSNGARQIAEDLWPLIEWCLEYLHRKVTAQGVVASDSDELERRFPAGKANLSTSSLYYDALRSAVFLGRELGKSRAQLEDYSRRATDIRSAIEQYFGADVEGFRTYRYYDRTDLADSPKPEVRAYASEPDKLRSWIAMPLAMGIFDRKEGTLAALFSSRLWTADGLATEEGQVTYWDRSTLYALRGALAAGSTPQAMERLQAYTVRRLLGDHVPYPVEAFPEGGGAQLAAESALYCRVFTEGLFGIRPTGLRSFELTPRLPQSWSFMALRNVHAFGSVFDLQVSRTASGKARVAIRQVGQRLKVYNIDSGGTRAIQLESPPRR